ncbi:hypothetical protein RI367_005608 [Sorochytrium milnesiophthora]
MPSREILSVGLNPAFQTTLHFSRFAAGRVNRAFRKSHSIGGKGQNVAIACQQYGRASQVTVLQFVGGPTGEYIRSVLDEKGIHHVSVITDKPTRVCTTVLDFQSNTSTELIEPSSKVSAEELEQFRSLVDSMLVSDTPASNNASPTQLRAMALCGTYPSGVDGRIYEYICERKPDGVFLLLDAYKDTALILQTGKVDVLKINCEEACQLAQIDHAPNICPAIGKKLMSLYKIRFLAVTNGPSSAFLFTSPTDYVEFTIPSLRSVVRKHPHSRAPSAPQLPKSSLESPAAASPQAALPHASDSLSHLRLLTRFSKLSDSSPSLPSPVMADAEPDTSAATAAPRERSALSAHSTVAADLVGLAINGDPNSAGSQDEVDDEPLVLNPLGAGDTCSGVFLASYLDSGDVVDSYRRGLAAASASCLVTESTAHFDMDVMMTIYHDITASTVTTA